MNVKLEVGMVVEVSTKNGFAKKVIAKINGPIVTMTDGSRYHSSMVG